MQAVIMKENIDGVQKSVRTEYGGAPAAAMNAARNKMRLESKNYPYAADAKAGTAVGLGAKYQSLMCAVVGRCK